MLKKRERVVRHAVQGLSEETQREFAQRIKRAVPFPNDPGGELMRELAHLTDAEFLGAVKATFLETVSGLARGYVIPQEYADRYLHATDEEFFTWFLRDAKNTRNDTQ